LNEAGAVGLYRRNAPPGILAPRLNHAANVPANLIHKTLRPTPAVAAKVTERLWEMNDIVHVLEAREATQ
jgi:hypothetical protein